MKESQGKIFLGRCRNCVSTFAVSQAGVINFNRGNVKDGFGRREEQVLNTLFMNSGHVSEILRRD